MRSFNRTFYTFTGVYVKKKQLYGYIYFHTRTFSGAYLRQTTFTQKGKPLGLKTLDH